MTRQQKQAISKINTWKNSTDTQLSDVYGRHSTAKDEAFEYCKNLCRKLNGTRLRIVTHNLNVFTAGFQYADKDTGVLYYMHITPTCDTAVEMN